MPAENSSFKVYQKSAESLLGSSPKLELLFEDDYPFAHEAGVFIQEDNTLFVTSNRYSDPETGESKITITRVDLPTGGEGALCQPIDAPGVPMANGGVNYKNGILFCAQGTLQAPGGLVYMDSKSPHGTHTLISSFHGRDFNSVNDVVVHSDGSIWFTDPIYGWEQGIRPQPRLPNQVYRYDPETGSIRAIADGFGRPNGICFSPDEKTVYITDTDWIHGGSGGSDDTRPSHIYAFDVIHVSEQPFLTNRRLFAMADTGIPDGIKCDVYGNVYSGCGDGVNIWTAGGVLIAKICIEGGVANFCFGHSGAMYLLNESKLWKAQLSPSTKGALLRI